MDPSPIACRHRDNFGAFADMFGAAQRQRREPGPPGMVPLLSARSACNHLLFDLDIPTMKTSIRAIAFAALFSLAGAAPVQAQQAHLSGGARQLSEADQAMAAIHDEAQLTQQVASSATAGDWQTNAAALRRLVQIRPQNPHYRYQLAVAYAQLNDKTGGYDTLLALQASGMAYDLESDQRLASLRGTQVWDHLVRLNTEAREPFGEGALAFELAPADLLLESIVHDPAGKAFFFGSARDGQIYRRGDDGKLAAWAKPQGEHWWSIMHLALDPDGKHLWATSAAVPHFRAFKVEMGGQSSLLKIALADGHLVDSWRVPDDGMPHVLNAVAVSSRGVVVVAEGLRGQLFKLEDGALAPLMAEPQLNALRGLAFSADGMVLYLADFQRGLFGMDLRNNTAFDLAAPANVNLYGIEGLYQYEGQLIAVQSGIQPQRIMRLKLDQAGRQIALAVPLESSQPEFATPTVGTLVGSRLHYIANTQRGYYDGYGLRRTSRELPPVKVYATDVRFNWDWEPPRMPGQ